jgi:hypothetical protein
MIPRPSAIVIATDFFTLRTAHLSTSLTRLAILLPWLRTLIKLDLSRSSLKSVVSVLVTLVMAMVLAAVQPTVAVLMAALLARVVVVVSVSQAEVDLLPVVVAVTLLPRVAASLKLRKRIVSSHHSRLW